MRLSKGDFVEMDGLPGVVVEILDDTAPDDLHLVVWFGEPATTRPSQGGQTGTVPIVWSVPADTCLPAQTPAVQH